MSDALRGDGPRAPAAHADRLPFRVAAASTAYDTLARLPVTVVLDNVRSAYNAGAFFRTADNAGVQRLVLCGITPTPAHASVAKTALGAETSVAWSHIGDTLQAVRALRAEGVEVACLETAPHAIDLFDWGPRFPVCVVFGHEVDGVSAAVREACDVFVRVPTLGRKHSLNVATAGGVVCYELLRKYRALQR